MAAERRIALCVATFYTELAEKLEQGARAALAEAGIDEADRFEVPRGHAKLYGQADIGPMFEVALRALTDGGEDRGTGG